MIVLGVLVIVGFYVGTTLSRRATMTRRERKELAVLRRLRDELMATAIDYSAIDNKVATIVLDEISKANREVERL